MQRTNARLARRFFLLLPGATALGVLSSIALGQLEHGADATILRQVVTGCVCLPDGSPASGAVVVTSAGGHVVTGADGSFTLEVELPLDAESLEVTAVVDGETESSSLVANARIVPAALSPITSVGNLLLSPSLTCHPRWLSTFGNTPGTDDTVDALAVFDDGDGPALYAGGKFTTAGGVTSNCIARWNGSSWSALGSGVAYPSSNPRVHALTVYDDGGGPALYAAGWFVTAGGVATNNIAKWDGSGWSALGSGLSSSVHALAVHDDGSGPALYAGGDFTTAGGIEARRIARWDGSNWSAVGSTGQIVFALTVYDDGGGPALYAGGYFSNKIKKWNGSGWSFLGSGLSGSGVLSLAVYDDGSGPALYAGGLFYSAAASLIAKWSGSSWVALGSGVSGSGGPHVSALTVYDDGSGPALYVGGDFTTAGGVAAEGIARWDGSSWTALANGIEFGVGVNALTVHDDGSGPALYVGGPFWTVGGVPASNISKWDGSSWSGLGIGLDERVRALAVHDDGNGLALYAGGDFEIAGNVPAAKRIAKWDGTSWAALGSGMNSVVYALTVHDVGSGPALYAGGAFSTAGGVAANRVAKWNGASWVALGGGLNSSVNALAVYDDGGGPALYAGGLFTTSGGVTVNRISRWDGTSWSALGSGVNDTVHSLTAYDDDSGPALYVGGEFTTAGGVAVNHIAKWDGSSWSALGSGMTGGAIPFVLALAVFDDGGGPALYAGGPFSTAGGVAASKIAKWDGSNWSALGGGVSLRVDALAVHDDGRGLALYAGGEFSRRVARWDGSSWETLGLGINSKVLALASWDDGDGPALYAGGEFTVSPAGDSYLAEWGCRPKPTVKRRKL